MATTLNSAKLSYIINLITQEKINTTESFIQTAGENSTEADAVSIMVNGKETLLSLSDYNLLKAKNKELSLKMKAEIKTLTGQFKANLKNEIKKKIAESNENNEDESIL